MEMWKKFQHSFVKTLRILSKMIGDRLVPDFDLVGIEVRAYGLLFWDRLRCSSKRLSSTQASKFIDFLLANDLDASRKKDPKTGRYVEHDLRRYREAFRIASLCIEKGDIVATDTKGEGKIPFGLDWALLEYDYHQQLRESHL